MYAILKLKHYEYIFVNKIKLASFFFINKLKVCYYKNYKEKHQKDFFQFLKILNKININNRAYNIIDNYIFKRDKIFFKKKLNKKKKIVKFIFFKKIQILKKISLLIKVGF